MVLEEAQIVELIEKGANENIQEWRKQNTKLCLFLEGGDVAKALELIKNYENYDQKKLREKLAKSTKDLMSYLLNPINKVFTASGFNREFDFSTETIQNGFSEYIDDLPQGISILKWMEIYWKRAFICDPNSILLIESDEEGNPYPTYKSIQTVRHFEKTWEKYEYIVFEKIQMDIAGSKKDCFRIIDDEIDAYYYLTNRVLNIVEEPGFEPILHNRGYIPAVTSSDIIDVKTGGYLSFISVVDEALQEHLVDSSVHSIYKFLHGFPLFWSYAMECATCEGRGKVIELDSEGNSTGNKITCPTCQGKRVKVTRDVSDGIRLPIPKNSQVNLGDKIAGYIQPALETWKMQNEELYAGRRDMHFALWGTHTTEDEKHDTALGRYIDEQPVNEKLNSVSDTGQKKSSQLLSFMAMMKHQAEEKSVKEYWGRRYMVESVDQLWDKYIEAKNNNAPITSLNDIYEEYLSSKFRNDQLMLDTHLKMLKIEPLPHYSLNDLRQNATPEMLGKKLLFTEWLNTDPDFDKEMDVLLNEFNEYFNNNYTPVEDENTTEV